MGNRSICAPGTELEVRSVVTELSFPEAAFWLVAAAASNETVSNLSSEAATDEAVLNAKWRWT